MLVIAIPMHMKYETILTYAYTLHTIASKWHRMPISDDNAAFVVLMTYHEYRW